MTRPDEETLARLAAIWDGPRAPPPWVQEASIRLTAIWQEPWEAGQQARPPARQHHRGSDASLLPQEKDTF